MGINYILYFLLVVVIGYGIFYVQYSYLHLKNMLKGLPIKNFSLKAASDITVNGFYRGKPIEIRISRRGKYYVPYVNFEIPASFPFEMRILRGAGFGLSHEYVKIKVGDEENTDVKYSIEVKKDKIDSAQKYLDLKRKSVIDAIFYEHAPGITKPWVNMILFDESSIAIKLVNFSYQTLTSSAMLKILNLMCELIPN